MILCTPTPTSVCQCRPLILSLPNILFVTVVEIVYGPYKQDRQRTAETQITESIIFKLGTVQTDGFQLQHEWSHKMGVPL